MMTQIMTDEMNQIFLWAMLYEVHYEVLMLMG